MCAWAHAHKTAQCIKPHTNVYLSGSLKQAFQHLNIKTCIWRLFVIHITCTVTKMEMVSCSKYEQVNLTMFKFKLTSTEIIFYDLKWAYLMFTIAVFLCKYCAWWTNRLAVASMKSWMLTWMRSWTRLWAFRSPCTTRYGWIQYACSTFTIQLLETCNSGNLNFKTSL